VPPAPKLGRLGGLLDERAEASVRGAMRAAIDALRAAGADIREAALPRGFDEVLPRHRIVMAVEAAGVHERRFAEHPDDYLPAIRSLIEEGIAVPATEYSRCREHQVRLRREILSAFAEADVLVCPATTGPAPDRSTTGDPAFNSPWSYVGLPTVSFPVGLDEQGLPLSIQLVGRPFAEASLFRAAAWCERALVKGT
jgi:aspartyl-tRNA(Asn)/glutamyl-tRNA(Gln) amidotransferase subunit A